MGHWACQVLRAHKCHVTAESHSVVYLAVQRLFVLQPEAGQQWPTCFAGNEILCLNASAEAGVTA